MSLEKSDYNRRFLDLFEQLPSVYRSDASRSLMHNLFNRFLSKQEVKKVAGYIGEPNKFAIVRRQIEEPDLHRQAFQLQPLLNAVTGTVRNLASWKDIENELERLGVDIEDMDNWGSVQLFNWAPPIDIDKLINFRDYFWTEQGGVNSQPEYITVRSRCAVANSNVYYWDDVMETYGRTIPITDILLFGSHPSYTFPTHDIISIDKTTNRVIVEGDATGYLNAGDFCYINDTSYNNGIHECELEPLLETVPLPDNRSREQTVFFIKPGTINSSESIGTMNIRFFDKIALEGDLTTLFEEDLLFYIKNSTNPELNNGFWKVIGSEYNETSGETEVQINGIISNNVVSGHVSFEENRDLATVAQKCACGDPAPWDVFRWDDNPVDPPDDIATWLASISNIYPPPTGFVSPMPEHGDQWYDTTADIYYQYNAEDNDKPMGWVVTIQNFSLVIESATENAYWDFTRGCDVQFRQEEADQWIDVNKWIHRTEVDNYSGVRAAQYPIIEFDFDLQLNEWAYTDYEWMYRPRSTMEWYSVDDDPALIELTPIDLWERDTVTDSIVIDERYGDMTAWFTPGKQFRAFETDEIYTVLQSYYSRASETACFQTHIRIEQEYSLTDLVSGDLSNVVPSTTPLKPHFTGQGDRWYAYGDHWQFYKKLNPVAIDRARENLLAEDTYIVGDLESPIESPAFEDGYFVYSFTPVSQTMSVLRENDPNERDILFEDATFMAEPFEGTTRRLNRRTLVGSNDMRVYINDVRQYGNYAELVDVELDITAVSIVNDGAAYDRFTVSSVIPVDEDNVPIIGAGDLVKVELNTAAVNGVYTVSAVQSNIIEIDHSATPIPSGTIAKGTLSCITTPITGPETAKKRFVNGIRFDPDEIKINAFDEVKIVVGEPCQCEVGKSILPVNISTGAINPSPIYMSLVSRRKTEQVKAKKNQYPLYDLYTLDGASYNKASQIFGFNTSPDSPINNAVGERIVYDADTKTFEFKQYLIDHDNGPMHAYRDFSNQVSDYWYKPDDGKLFFWRDGVWVERVVMGNYFHYPFISPQRPTGLYNNIDGAYWYDPVNNVLKIRNMTTETWDLVDTEVVVSLNDHTLQTIWKSGQNSEKYIPQKVDWDARTEDEYNEDKEVFIEKTANDLKVLDPTMSDEEAEAEAERLWFAKESNVHSETGAWIGDWEIPDPMYYNNMHENRVVLNSAELRVHFNTIIDGQKKVPGYSGSIQDMFHLIPSSDVNYGVGGQIHEYNDGFDTFLSSAFVKNVTPLGIIDFAGTQYDVLLMNSIIESYRDNINDYLTTTDPDALNDLLSYVVNDVIERHWENDFYGHVYGDTTTFTEGSDGNDLGMRNWIATLPYINLMYGRQPYILEDDKRGIKELVHHDGHRKTYDVLDPVIETIINVLINTPDERTRDPQGNLQGTWGVLSNTELPSDNQDEFENSYGTTIDSRVGVYWYYKPNPGVVGTLYRFNVVWCGTDAPLGIYDDGSLWYDNSPGDEVLKIKRTVGSAEQWVVVDGLSEGDKRLHNGTDPEDMSTATVSAWEVTDITDMMYECLLAVEEKLFENTPSKDTPLRYDMNDIESINSYKYTEYKETAFLDYLSDTGMVGALQNNEYDLSDPWTWNYKYSIQGGGYRITHIDAGANKLGIEGNYPHIFDPCTYHSSCPSQVEFNIKSNGDHAGAYRTAVSDGQEPVSSYSASQNVTWITVDANVTTGYSGTIYFGDLPSSGNDGSESGGCWQDFYEKLYGTPYPHLEPWKLQGYDGKPTWWDEEYLVTDTDKWGDRTWRYRHGFDIQGTGVASGENYFAVNGNFVSNFTPGETVEVDQSPGEYDGVYTVGNMMQITGYLITAKEILVQGDKRDDFSAGNKISISRNNVIVGEYTVADTRFIGPDPDPGLDLKTAIEVVENIDSSSSFDYIAHLYDDNTNQAHVYMSTSIPSIGSPSSYGRFLKGCGMWGFIKAGRIPAGRTYPNGVVSVTGVPADDRSQYDMTVEDFDTWSYFSVNIDNYDVSSDGGTTNYGPDELLPPFWDHREQYENVSTFDSSIRSVYYDYGTEIISAGADYIFGDRGPAEWEWAVSVNGLYSELNVWYRMDPVRYVTHTFGIDFYYHDELQLDKRTDNTFSHNRTRFHGDIVDDTLLKFSGSNQWYVNYNRYIGYDNNFAGFSCNWKAWEGMMSYQFATFLDTPSFQMGHRVVDVSQFDYTIDMKRSLGVEDYWLDAFRVSILDMPPRIIRNNNQSEWKLEVNSNLDVSRSVDYYGVQNYPFYADPETDECSLYTWPIVDVDPYNSYFEIEGDQTQYFDRFSIIVYVRDLDDGLGNTGLYWTGKNRVVYNASTNRTQVSTYGDIPNISAGGTLQITGNTMPKDPDTGEDLWNTGDILYPTSDGILPVPLLGETPNGLDQVFLIVIDDYRFKLARTRDDAMNGLYMDIRSEGIGTHYIGKVRSTFKAFNGKTVTDSWINYELDKARIMTINMPDQITGMQTLVDFINGYSIYAETLGWKVNADGLLYDDVNGRIVDWHYELERFIDHAYSLRDSQYKVDDTFEFDYEFGSDVMTFIDPNPNLVTGNKVMLKSGTNTYPSPLLKSIPYYFSSIDNSTFKLCQTSRDAERGIGVTIDIPAESPAEKTKLYMIKPLDKRFNYPTTSINPFRNAIWFSPESGIISNILTGPTEDIRTVQTVLDQYGRKFTVKDIRVFRQDKETKIYLDNDIPNLVDPPYSVLPSPNDYLYIGGMHLFTDTYEHVMIFNKYTTGGDLLYDPFVGLNLTKFEMLFNRQLLDEDADGNKMFNHRPNMGGYYYHAPHNMTPELKENFEASVESLRYAYDTFRILESNKLATEVRKGLGYAGIEDYLSKININEKSQFLFWRGFIQQKGSMNSVNAYLNSKRFINAKLDEFWALKIATYGSAEEKEWPEINLTTVDARNNDLRLQFIE